MDKETLVRNGQNLIDEMDRNGIPPRAVVWVYNPDTETWRLWVVPPQNITDKREFYIELSKIITNNSEKFWSFDASDVQMTPEKHQAVQALRKIFHVSGKSDVHVSNSMYNGYFIPDGVILRMNV